MTNHPIDFTAENYELNQEFTERPGSDFMDEVLGMVARIVLPKQKSASLPPLGTVEGIFSEDNISSIERETASLPNELEASQPSITPEAVAEKVEMMARSGASLQKVAEKLKGMPRNVVARAKPLIQKVYSKIQAESESLKNSNAARESARATVMASRPILEPGESYWSDYQIKHDEQKSVTDENEKGLRALLSDEDIMKGWYSRLEAAVNKVDKKANKEFIADLKKRVIFELKAMSSGEASRDANVQEFMPSKADIDKAVSSSKGVIITESDVQGFRAALARAAESSVRKALGYAGEGEMFLDHVKWSGRKGASGSDSAAAIEIKNVFNYGVDLEIDTAGGYQESSIEFETADILSEQQNPGEGPNLEGFLTTK